MPHPVDKVKRFFDLVRNKELTVEMIRHKDIPEQVHIPKGADNTSGTAERRAFLEERGLDISWLSGQHVFDDYEALHGNIEQYIGMAQIPTGIIGPLRILGSEALGDFIVPLATTEGTLIASYDRGAKATRMSGGITSVCISEGVQRSPVFKFKDLADLSEFLVWTLDKVDIFREIVANTSRFGQLSDYKVTIEGNHLILTFEYLTGDASGQNMVTLCTDAICRYIIAENPVKPLFWFIESNYSGDKKATSLSFTSVRGKKVTAEINLSNQAITEVLKTTPEAMAQYWLSATCGIIQSGAIGAHGHIANGLCALFIATGQDVACVSEAAVGLTRMELDDRGGLYVAVTLPNLIVGTVGGGTWLPTQQECLRMIGCDGNGKARKLAEIAGAVILAGEVSIAAALSAGHFSSAHARFGRKKDKKD